MSAGPCVFCEILAGRAPARIVAGWPDAFAIHSLNPVTVGHLLVIPHAHVEDFRQSPAVSALTMARAAELASTMPCDANLITSAGVAATQTVRHLHLHLVPRRTGDRLALPWTGQKPGGSDD